MLLVPLVNVVLLITLNSAIPMFTNNPQPPANKSHELPLAWPPHDGYCRKNATCVSLNHTTCLGIPLPYSETTTQVVSHLFNGTAPDLDLWLRLRNVRKCWTALQPFLCALYMPKCEHDTVYLPSQERCKYMMATCRILNESVLATFIPGLHGVDCDDVNYFPPTCKNDVRDLRSNLSGACTVPLIATENAESQYDVVNGCGIQCEDPLLTKEEHEQIHKMIAWGATISLLCNLFAVVSFLIEWRSGNKYPALIIFYINVCFLVSNLGFLAQFIPNSREDIVCKKDMTLRKAEPSAGENLTCVIVFVMVYYFLMAACVWFVILTYAWHLSFQALGQGSGKIQERIDKKGAYFHLVAWSLPVVLTISTMALREIDGNSIAGICFVGSSRPGARVGLVLVPVAATVAVGAYFLSRGMPFLFSIKKDSQQILSLRASAKIREMIVRIGLFALFCLVFVLVTFICHLYEFNNQENWQMSLRRHIFCMIMSKNPAMDCRMESRPSVAMIQLHLLGLFVAGVVMSSWVWTSSTIDRWRRFLNRVCNNEIQEPIVLKKHKIIAQAFAKRKELNNAGKLEISIHNTHTDPVGLNFELNSTASHLSSNWMAAFPKLVDRRGALIDVTTESNSSHRRRNSCDSESYTYSVRRVSVESRRQSVDSQISLQISELTATHKTNTPRPSHHGRSRGKRRRKEYSRSRRHQNVIRRGSSTSQESQLGIQILTALAINANKSNILPNLLKRRQGNAGLDAGDASSLGKFSVPDLSDDNSQDLIPCPMITAPSDGEQSNGSDDALCPPGQGIQKLGAQETDSDDTQQYTDMEEEESAHIAKISRKERTLTVPGCSKNRLDVEYHRKSFRQEKKNKYKPEDYKTERHSKTRLAESMNGRRKKTQEEDCLLGRSSRQQPKIMKVDERKIRDVRKSSNSEFEENISGKKRNSGSDAERMKYRNRASVALQKSLESKASEQLALEESESEPDVHAKLVQSAGVQYRAGSSRSKRSGTVDVGTQISTQEMATQTDPHDFTPSATNQGTQMTPPFHIRLINKTLGGNCHASQLRENYSYISLTDPSSDACGK